MTYDMLVRKSAQRLSAEGCDDAMLEARCLLEYCTKKSRTFLMVNGESEAPDELSEKMSEFVSRRACGEPLQYIIGEWEFMGHRFSVGEGVLIPRPETELLVEAALDFICPDSEAVIFDVCAGSGCIGISVASERKKAWIYSFEKYAKTYEYLLGNIETNGTRNVMPVQYDMFDGYDESLPKPDLILSNPPYIKTSEIKSLQREVRHEPTEALDGGEDGLCFYRALRQRWYPFLKTGGMLAVECGEAQAREVAEIFSGCGETEIIKDLNGIERIVTVRKVD